MAARKSRHSRHPTTATVVTTAAAASESSGIPPASSSRPPRRVLRPRRSRAVAPTDTANTVTNSLPSTAATTGVAAAAATATANIASHGPAAAVPVSSLLSQNGDKVSLGPDSQRVPQGRSTRSRWDLLPPEVRRYILNVAPGASPLLRHLGKCLSPEQTAIEARRIWIEALAQPSCDVELVAALPHPDWAIPTAADGLCELRSREVYERLKIMRPDLLGWLPDGKEANRMLIHVAMRNCWMDELVPVLESNGAQCLAAAAIKYGHADLLVRFISNPNLGEGVDFNKLFLGFECYCKESARLGSYALFVAARDLAVGWSGFRRHTDCMKRCVEELAKKNDIEFLRKLSVSYKEEFFASFRPDCDSGLDTWEWLCDTFGWTGVDCTDMVVPHVTSVDDVKRVLARASSISYKLLAKRALEMEPGAFSLLWPCRTSSSSEGSHEWKVNNAEVKDISSPREAQVHLALHGRIPSRPHPATIALLPSHDRKESAARAVCRGDDLDAITQLYHQNGWQGSPFFNVMESATDKDDLRKLLFVTRDTYDGQILRLIFKRACQYAPGAILCYCFNRWNVNNDVLWEGFAVAYCYWQTATAREVWRHISERDPTHSAQPAWVLSSLKTSFERFIEHNRPDLVTFFCDSGIAKPSQDDVVLAVQHRRLDILRYFLDDPTCPKSMTAKDLRTAIGFWADHRHTFQESVPIFDFVMERFSIVGREPQVVYKIRDLAQVLLQAPCNMKDKRLKNYIREFRYRRHVLASE